MKKKPFAFAPYPIVAVAMNQVSNIDFAIATALAGAMPSLSLFEYHRSNRLIDFDSLKRDMVRYKETVGNTNLVLSIDNNNEATFAQTVLFVKEFSIPVVEFLSLPTPQQIETFQQAGAMVFGKTTGRPVNTELALCLDGLFVKGSAAAGRTNQLNGSLEHMSQVIVNAFPNQHIIPCGGVASAAQVKCLLAVGAAAVGVGTYFAAAAETRLSAETKQRMVAGTSADLSLLATSNASQSALVFSPVEQDDENNTYGLIEGITTGTTGHIMAGAAIDTVTGVYPIAKLVQNLVPR